MESLITSFPSLYTSTKIVLAEPSFLVKAAATTPFDVGTLYTYSPDPVTPCWDPGVPYEPVNVPSYFTWTHTPFCGMAMGAGVGTGVGAVVVGTGVATVVGIVVGTGVAMVVGTVVGWIPGIDGIPPG